MGYGLGPLEFSECLVDSPSFREKLRIHEKELDITSQQIKQLSKEIKELLSAARNLSIAQRKLSSSLKNFSFSGATTPPTDDELVLQSSFQRFAELISHTEDLREAVIEASSQQILIPLDNFRKLQIGNVREHKKKFEKQTGKFCQLQERYLNLSSKKQDSQIKEADATLDMEERELCQASMQYVLRLQEVEELKKIEIVESLLSFLQSWFAFYHQGHEAHEEFKPYMSDLQLKIQKTRESFHTTRDQAESLMKKMLELRQQKAADPSIGNKSDKYNREGYLYLMEKKAFNTSWTKQYCRYRKDTKEFEMSPYNQLTSKALPESDKFILASCTRRTSDSIEKRFCFDLVPSDRPGVVLTLQALSEKDRNNWMDVMDGIEPTYATPGNLNKEERPLDEVGFQFISRCLDTLESRGLEEQGLYRVVGVASKVQKLLAMGLDRRKAEKLSLDDPCEWESKTITSALKTYLRHLPEPLMTFRLHQDFIEAAKRPTNSQRVASVHVLVRQLPKQNFQMLDMLIYHLTNVAAKADKNLMSISNLGVCFGPTLLRPAEETVAAILNIKFCNVVVEIMIHNYERIFKTEPDPSLDTSSMVIDSRIYGSSSGLRQAPMKAAHQLSHHQAIYGSAISRPNASSPGPSKRNAMAPSRHNYSGHNAVENPVKVAIATFDYINDGHSSTHKQNSSQSAPNSARNREWDRERDHRMDPGGSEPLNSNGSSSDSTSSRELYGVDDFARAVYARTESPDLLSLPPYGRASSPDGKFGGETRVRSSFARTSSPDIIFPPAKDSRASLGIYPPPLYRPSGEQVRVRTLYACLGENDGELSFDPNQIITNVRQSMEPGWLEGTLNGKTGLIPENYVEILP